MHASNILSIRAYAQTAKTQLCQDTKFETNIPRIGIEGPQSQFHIHVSERDLYIPMIGLPILLQEVCGPILGIQFYITHRHINVEIWTEAAQFP